MLVCAWVSLCSGGGFSVHGKFPMQNEVIELPFVPHANRILRKHLIIWLFYDDLPTSTHLIYSHVVWFGILLHSLFKPNQTSLTFSNRSHCNVVV